MSTSTKPAISPHLLWEYDLNTFDFDQSKKVVIERVIQRGNLADWRLMCQYYGTKNILQVSRSSKQLSKKDQGFTELFLQSSLLDSTSHK